MQALFFCPLGEPCPFIVSAHLIASADPGSFVSVRLLGVAVGVLDINDPKGTRGDEGFVVGTLGGENTLHSSTLPAPQSLSYAL